MEILLTVKQVGRKAIHVRDLVRRERRATLRPDIPPHELLRWWSRGFLGESVVYYGLTEDNWRGYVSDYTRAVRTPLINGRHYPTLSDKLIFYHTMVSLSAATPTVYGLVGRDGISWLHPPGGIDAEPDLPEMLRQGREIVLKPIDGGLGDRIVFLDYHDGTIRSNGKPCSELELGSLLRPGTLICERIRQGRYAAEIFEGSTNSLRVITMWDYNRRTPFIAAAEHRFGTHRSAPVDNTSKGGVFAAVDLGTGRLGRIAPTKATGERLAHHPDSGKRVEGTTIPNWTLLVNGLLSVSRRLAHIPYIGWDVVVGDDRYQLIEGNTAPDTQTQAVSGPLLADPRVRRFYEYHGTIARG